MTTHLGISLTLVTFTIMNIEVMHKSVDNVKELKNTYDYIVIGLGSSGAVVANRLAEDPNIKVLALEAGKSQSILTDIPMFAPILTGSAYDWKFESVPQKRMGLAFEGQRIPHERGKAIGGSSTINLMIYNRGNRKDYDNWANTYGAIGWDYKSVLRYFMKSENNSDFTIVNENLGYHGTDGPLGISTTSSPDPILLETIQAMNQLGFKSIDINGEQQIGTTISQMSIKDGLRASTANAYLEPNPYPNNLFISIHSYVTKIIMKKKIAVGVEFIKYNNKYRVYAKKEVILCAGAIQSPQILMLSGIGPKHHLNQFGIPVIADLPVGNNFQNHLILDIYAIVNDKNKVTTPASPLMFMPNLYKLYAKESSDLSKIPVGITYFNTIYNEDMSWPSAAIFAFALKGTFLRTRAGKYDSSIKHKWDVYNSQFLKKRLLILSPFLARIRTVGKIRLNSINPLYPPEIDPNFLSDHRDYQNFVESVRFAFFVLETSLLSAQVTVPELPIPGCSYCSDLPIYKCDKYIKCLIRQIGRATHHHCGTCRMGSVHRKDVVVDHRLRVKGIHNLRVCDTSIMPEIINSNTNAAAIMIGEYGADLIKADNYA